MYSLMKRSAAVVLAAVMVSVMSVSCGHKGTTIHGVLSVAEAEGTMMYLYDYASGHVMDSVRVTDSCFTFSGEYPDATLLEVRGGNCRLLCVAEPGEVYLNPVTDSLSGTPLNDRLGSYLSGKAKAVNPMMEEQQRLIYQYQMADREDTAQMGQLGRAFAEWNMAYNNVCYTQASALYADNEDNVLGAYAVYQMAMIKEMTATQLDSVMQSASPVVAQFEPLKRLSQRMHQIDVTAEGMPYVELQGISYPDYSPTTLSALIDGRLAVVDFWASWCGPCRQEISETLVPLYAKYRDQGLQIVGVDISDKLPEHQAAMEALRIDYPQLIDTTGDAAQLYGIQSIPTILLIGKDGTIVARDLRGERLVKAVEENLKN